MNVNAQMSFARQILELVAEYHAKRVRPGGVCPSRPDRRCPVSGRVFDAADMQHSGGCLAGFLADHRPLRRSSSSASSPASSGVRDGHAGQLGLFRQPAGAVRASPRPSWASARCSPAMR